MVGAVLAVAFSAVLTERVVATPDAAIAGETSSVDLAYFGPPPERLAVEVGHTEVIESGARWHIPSDLLPRRIAYFWIDASTHEPRFSLLPVSRRAKLQVTASPNAHVRLRLDATNAVEGRADSKGKLALRVLVPPAVDLAAIEQEDAQTSDVLQRLRALGVRNQLRLFVPPPEAAFVPDDGREQQLLAFVYRDDGNLGAESLAITSEELRVLETEDLGRGVYRVRFVVPISAARSASARLRVRATYASDEAVEEIELALAPLPATAIRLDAPPLPWRAGSRVIATAQAIDALERPVDLALAASLEGEADDFILTVDSPSTWTLVVPRVLPERAPVLVVRGGGLKSELPLRLRADVPTRLVLEVEPGGEGELTRRIRVSAYDAAANPCAPGQVEVAATAGVVTPVRAGGQEFLWESRGARAGEAIGVEARYRSEDIELRATTYFVQENHAREISIGGYVGVALGSEFTTAPSATVVVDANPLTGKAADLRLLGLASVTRARRDDKARIDGGDTFTIERTAYMVPIAAGLGWRLVDRDDIDVLLGLTSGAMLSLVEARTAGGAYTRRDAGVAWSYGALARVGVRAGSGKLGLLLSGLDVLTLPDTWKKRPRALELSLGYHWQP